MSNINDVSPQDIAQASQGSSQNISSNIFSVNPDDIQTPEQVTQEKYGSTGQQLIAGLEGAAQGIAGPLAPLAETKLLNVNPEDIRGRAEANPITHGLSQAAGFAGSLFADAGIAPLVTNIGEKAAALTGLKGATTLSKIAQTGIKTGAEMATLQAGDEVSKAITQDPGASLGQAAINVGLSGIIGGAGGVVLGAVSPLWKATIGKVGIPDLIDNAKAQYSFRQANPDLASGAVDELTNRVAEVEDMHSKMGNLKGEALAKAMPDFTLENTAKIDSQINDISNNLTSKIEDASEDVYLKNSVPKLAQHLDEFQEAVANPNASYIDKFNAVDGLKKSLQNLAKYDSSAEDSALGTFAKKMAYDLRVSLEDSKIWGEAGNVQKNVNAAITDSIKAQKDLASKFTSKLMGEGNIDPNKVQTYLNQTSKSKAGLKLDVVQNYLNNTQKVADTINKIHTDAGLEAPIASKLNPTPVLNKSLDQVNAGTHLGNWLYDKGLGDTVGSAAAEGVGGGIGSLVGHPWLGASAGQYVLGPFFRSIAKPMLEKATNSEAMKSAVDYVGSVIKGDKLLNAASKNFFKAGAEILPEGLMPDNNSRNKLQKSLDSVAANPNKMMEVGGNLGHYMPDHATSAAATASTAINYLNSLKPKTIVNSLLDSQPPVDKAQLQKYNRALDIAQQPLLVLDYARNGSIQPQDVITLKTIYPNLYSKIVDSLNNSLVQARTEGVAIPYSQRLGISILTGQPADSTLTQSSMQAIIGSALIKPAQTQVQQKKPTSAALKSSDKVNTLYQTPLQAREANKKP
jgi:hypothetical protein